MAPFDIKKSMSQCKKYTMPRFLPAFNKMHPVAMISAYMLAKSKLQHTVHALVWLCFVALSILEARAVTYYPGSFASLQAAINATPSGGVVRITNSSLMISENLTLNNSLTLRSVPAGALINGSVNIPGSPTVYLTDLNFSNTVTISNGAWVQISGCSFKAPVTGIFIPVTSTNATLNVYSSSFTGATNGVLFSNCVPALIAFHQSSFIQCANGVRMISPAAINLGVGIYRCYFRSNSVSGIYAAGGSLTVNQSQFLNGPTSVSEDCTVAGQKVQGYVVMDCAGASVMGSATLENNLFVGSRCAVRLYENLVANITHCTWADPNGEMYAAIIGRNNVGGQTWVNPFYCIFDAAMNGFVTSTNGNPSGSVPCWGNNPNLWNCKTNDTLLRGFFNQDPKFVNPAAGDFHLQSNSPCLGLCDDSATTVDLEGNARPLPAGSSADLGCYESAYGANPVGSNTVMVVLEQALGTSADDQGLAMLDCSLQGLLNRQAPRVYRIIANDWDDPFSPSWQWLQIFSTNNGVPYQVVGRKQLLNVAAQTLTNKYVLWTAPGNVASDDNTAAAMDYSGMESMIMVTSNLVSVVASNGFNGGAGFNVDSLLQSKATRAAKYDYLFTTYSNRMAKDRLAVVSAPDSWQTDWWIEHKTFCENLAWLNSAPDGVNEVAVSTKIFNWLPVPADVMGEAYNDSGQVPTIHPNNYGHGNTYKGAQNYSFFKWMTNANGKLTRVLPMPLVPAIDTNTIYIALHCSDGDALWTHTRFLHDMWVDPLHYSRSDIPIGWWIAKACLEDAPGDWEYYARTAHTNDTFILAGGCGPLWAGMTSGQYGSDMGQSRWTNYLKGSLKYFKDSGIMTTELLGGGGQQPDNAHLLTMRTIWMTNMLGAFQGYGGWNYTDGPTSQEFRWADFTMFFNRLTLATNINGDDFKYLTGQIMYNQTYNIVVTQGKKTSTAPLFLPCNFNLFTGFDDHSGLKVVTNYVALCKANETATRKYQFVRTDIFMALSQKWQYKVNYSSYPTPVLPVVPVWATAPTPQGSGAITMTAQAPTNGPGAVLYYFRCSGGGGHDSDWQTSPTYTDTNLKPGTTYSYQINIRDAAYLWNNTDHSTNASCTLLSPTGPITGSTNVLAGQVNVSYMITSVSGASNYVWTIPAGATIASGQGTTNLLVNFVCGTSSGIIGVTPINNNGDAGTTSSLSVAVTGMGAVGPISGLTNMTAGQSGVSYRITNVSGATTYNWTVPTNAVIASGQGTTNILVNWGGDGGNVTVIPVNANGCTGSGNVILTVTDGSQPQVPPMLISSARVEGDMFMFSVSALVTGFGYTLEATTNLANGPWVEEAVFTASSGSVMLTNHQNGTTQKFYRISH